MPIMDAIETLTARMLRSGNDAEALGTHSTSLADVRAKYKEAAAMFHLVLQPDGHTHTHMTMTLLGRSQLSQARPRTASTSLTLRSLH